MCPRNMNTKFSTDPSLKFNGYPAFFKDKHSRLVVFAFNKNSGIVVKVEPKYGYTLNEINNDFSCFEDKDEWVQVRGEVTFSDL